MKYKSLEEGLQIILNTLKVGTQSKELQWSDSLQNICFPRKECIGRIIHKATQSSHKHIAWAGHIDVELFDSAFWVMSYEEMQEYCLNEFGVKYPLTWFMCIKMSPRADKANPSWHVIGLYDMLDDNGCLNDMWYAALNEGKDAGLLLDNVIEDTVTPSGVSMTMTQQATEVLQSMADMFDLDIEGIIESKYSDFDMVLPHEYDDSL